MCSKVKETWEINKNDLNQMSKDENYNVWGENTEPLKLMVD